MSAIAEAQGLLRASETVLLIDWPTPDVPRALVEAGLDVFSHSPEGTTRARVVEEAPVNAAPGTVFEPKPGESGSLVLVSEAVPSEFDLVFIFRPPEEHRVIFEEWVSSSARCVWLQAPIPATEAAALAAERNLPLVVDLDIVEVARGLAQGESS